MVFGWAALVVVVVVVALLLAALDTALRDSGRHSHA
jgi:hypothetical protein